MAFYLRQIEIQSEDLGCSSELWICLVPPFLSLTLFPCCCSGKPAFPKHFISLENEEAFNFSCMCSPQEGFWSPDEFRYLLEYSQVEKETLYISNHKFCSQQTLEHQWISFFVHYLILKTIQMVFQMTFKVQEYCCINKEYKMSSQHTNHDTTYVKSKYSVAKCASVWELECGQRPL